MTHSVGGCTSVAQMLALLRLRMLLQILLSIGAGIRPQLHYPLSRPAGVHHQRPPNCKRLPSSSSSEESGSGSGIVITAAVPHDLQRKGEQDRSEQDAAQLPRRWLPIASGAALQVPPTISDASQNQHVMAAAPMVEEVATRSGDLGVQEKLSVVVVVVGRPGQRSVEATVHQSCRRRPGGISTKLMRRDAWSGMRSASRTGRCALRCHASLGRP